MFLQAKDNLQKKTAESYSWTRKKCSKAYTKTQELWKSLDDTFIGRTEKVAVSAALIGATTLFTGSGLGWVSMSSIGTKLGQRMLLATGLNMALTSNLPGKLFGKSKKENNGISEEKNWLRKQLTLGNFVSVGGIGASFLLSGGLIAAITAGGVVGRKITNYIFDKQIKKKEESIKNLFDNYFDINLLESKLGEVEQNYDKVTKSLKRLKWGKSLVNGALTIGVGLETMAVMQHQHEIGVKTSEGPTRHEPAPTETKHEQTTGEVKHESSATPTGAAREENFKYLQESAKQQAEQNWKAHDEMIKAQQHQAEAGTQPQHDAEVKTQEEIKQQVQGGEKNQPAPVETKHEQTTGEPKHENITKHQQEVRHQEILKAKIVESIKENDQVVHKGEGVEHTFIRQIEHNPELAKELGFKGDVNDAKALHEFAGKEAHIIAKDNGYTDASARTIQADTKAFEIKMENGHAVVLEKSPGGWEDKINDNLIKTQLTQPEDSYIHGVVPKMYQGPESFDTQGEFHNNYNVEEQPNHEAYINVLKQHTTPDQHGTEHGTETSTHPTETSQEHKTEYEDTSKQQHQTIIESSNNPYHLSNEVLEKVNQNLKTNLETIYPKDPNVLENMHLSAKEIAEQDLSTVNDNFKPIISYIQALEKYTGIHPIEATPFRAAETATEYVTRLEQMDAIKETVLKTRLEDGITHVYRVDL
ncbi:MAG: hypothetical protein WCS86_03055 [Candidatus Paceibacterota bacterium]